MKVKQLSHQEIQNAQRQFPLQVIAENISSPENVGMIFRICEAMGVEALVLSGESAVPPHRKISKTARSSEERVVHRRVEDTLAAIRQAQEAGFRVLALEITNTSTSIGQYDFRPHKKVVLVIGGERHGVDQATLEAVDGCVHIPMFGLNTSINVVTALSIGLYEVTRQWTSVQ